MKKQTVDVKWPFKGLDESSAFVRQRGGQNAYSTADCMNVVGFDPLTGRNRGASRAGIRKYCSAQVSGNTPGQCIAHVISIPEIGNRVTGTGSSPSRALRVTASGEARDLGPATPVPVGEKSLTVIAIADGDAAIVEPSGVTAITNGTNAFSPLPSVIFAESFFQDIYICDGANYKYFDVSAGIIAPWDAKNGGEMPAQPGEVKAISGASNASPIVITIASHGYVTNDQVTITGVLGNTAANGSWFITVINANTFSLNGATGNGAYTSGGSCELRRVGSRCALMAIWGGRVVLSGMQSDPNNIFMSAVGDPFNWDYSPEFQTVQQAVAGNVTSGYGKNIDRVTALIPYTDDILIIGGSRSIRKFMGNPAEGGVNVSVTDITGIAYGSAWCQSPEGVIYFFGSRGGVYMMEPNGIPSRLTATTIDERLSDLDLNNNVVTLVWDDRAIAVRVYITPKDGSETVHFVWDVRNQAWWPFEYSNAAHNPLAVHVLSGETSAERSILEYGQDGYIRLVDVDQPTDDGNPIESYVFLGPFNDSMLVHLEATLGEQSGNVTWAACTSSSEEKALTASPRATGRLHAGRNRSQWPRTFIERGYLKLSSTGPWAFEELSLEMEPASPTGKRTKRGPI